MPSELPYVASKAALSGTVLSLADHLAPRGITVNAVNPGPTDTGWASEEIVARAAAAMPRGRWGSRRTPRGWWRGWPPRSPGG